MAQMTDMALHEQQITINAPVPNVFAILGKLENFPRYAPGMHDAATVDDAFMVTYSPQVPGIKLQLPISFRFKLSLADIQEPRVVAMKVDGSMIKGTVDWSLEDQGEDATLVRVVVNYQMSVDVINNALSGGGEGGLLGKIGNAASKITNGVAQVITPLLNTNSSNVRKCLTNLKEMCES